MTFADNTEDRILGESHGKRYRNKKRGGQSYSMPIRILRVTALVVGIGLLVVAASVFVSEHVADSKWDGIRNEFTIDDGNENGTTQGDDGVTGTPIDDAVTGHASSATSNGIDWSALGSRNDDVRAWLRIDGTPIDYPVMQGGTHGHAGNWYLTHDIDGDWSLPGSLFISKDTTMSDRHTLVYGHHMGDTGQMFSTLHKMYRQNAFDGLRDATVLMPDGSTRTYHPLLAMSVDQSYKPIQMYGFQDADTVRQWLRDDILPDATAKADDADSLIDGTERVMTLVTCSSDIGGQRARTLVVFVETA